MAIIIGAIIALLIVALSYLKYKFNMIRREEKLIYDTFFLIAFFQRVINLYGWRDYFSKKHEIYVKRKVSVLKASEMKFNYNDGIYFKVKSIDELKKRERKVYCLEYTFEDNVEIRVYTYISRAYRGLIGKLKNTTFSFTINQSESKLEIRDSIDDRIFCVSKLTLYQCLCFALDNRIQRLNDMAGRWHDFIPELQETSSIIVELKKEVSSKKK